MNGWQLNCEIWKRSEVFHWRKGDRKGSMSFGSEWIQDHINYNNIKMWSLWCICLSHIKRKFPFHINRYFFSVSISCELKMAFQMKCSMHFCTSASFSEGWWRVDLCSLIYVKNNIERMFFYIMVLSAFWFWISKFGQLTLIRFKLDYNISLPQQTRGQIPLLLFIQLL